VTDIFKAMCNNILKKRLFLVFAVLILLLSGCSSSKTTPSQNSSKPPVSTKQEIYISTISWKDPYGNGGKCETGLEVANFWFEGSAVSVYDADTGDLLASTTLTSKKDDPQSRICDYNGKISVDEVQNYRFVFDKGRWQVDRSLADLKIMANQYPLADLVFIYELGA